MPGVFSGQLFRTTGPAFNAVPFNPANVMPTAVGTATFTFADGNNATFAYTVNGVSQSKAITREVFRAPGTVCQWLRALSSRMIERFRRGLLSVSPGLCR